MKRSPFTSRPEDLATDQKAEDIGELDTEVSQITNSRTNALIELLHQTKEFICDQQEDINFLDDTFAPFFRILAQIRTSFRSLAANWFLGDEPLGEDVSSLVFEQTCNKIMTNNHPILDSIATLKQAIQDHTQRVAYVCKVFLRHAKFIAAPYDDKERNTFGRFVKSNAQCQKLNHLFASKYLNYAEAQLAYFQAITGRNEFHGATQEPPLTEGNIDRLKLFLASHPNITNFLVTHCDVIAELSAAYNLYAAQTEMPVFFSDPINFDLLTRLFNAEWQSALLQEAAIEHDATPKRKKYPFATETKEFFAVFQQKYPKEYECLQQIMTAKYAQAEQQQRALIDFFREYPKATIYFYDNREFFLAMSSHYYAQSQQKRLKPHALFTPDSAPRLFKKRRADETITPPQATTPFSMDKPAKHQRLNFDKPIAGDDTDVTATLNPS
jgi:hypothetical protein